MGLAKFSPIFGVQARVWWGAISILQLLIGILMIVAVLCDEWIEIFFFKGGLYKIKDGDTYHNAWKDCSNDNDLCLTLYHLDIAASIYGSIAGFSFIFLVLWVIEGWRFILGKKFLTLKPYVHIILLSVLHIVSSVCWLIYANASPGNSCDRLIATNSQFEACLKDGANIIIALMIIIPVSGVLFLVILSNSKREETGKEEFGANLITRA